MTRAGDAAISQDEDPATVHAQVHNHFNQERTIIDRQSYKERRSGAFCEWRSGMG